MNQVWRFVFNFQCFRIKYFCQSACWSPALTLKNKEENAKGRLHLDPKNWSSKTDQPPKSRLAGNLVITRGMGVCPIMIYANDRGGGSERPGYHCEV